ncbi:DNA-binding transcriptional LysR family regulator [Bradyrhizobium algeriense]|uniref:DNA-binding transcriptional LysR family regulator n=1 Tax=Bradyrhizobium algeriense TaxID=634784 RepID=A0ABU8B7C3_9BRAD
MVWDDRIGRRLRLKDLHTLQTIAEVGSMAKAANLLALSQPAISKAIADMEHVVGASLLERGSRGVELTESGRILVARGRVIFDELREGLKDIEALADPTRGNLRIGIADPLTVVVSEIIAQLSSEYPRITYQVTISDATTTLRQLRDRELDVVLTRWNPETTPDDLSFEVLFHSPLTVLANKNNPLVKRKKLNLKDLMGERWTLSPPDSYLGRIVADVFRRKNLELPRSIVTTISIHMRVDLLASGDFISVLPTYILRHQGNGTWLRALDVDLGEGGPIAAITLKKRHPTGALKLFQETSRKVCKAIATSLGEP